MLALDIIFYLIIFIIGITFGSFFTLAVHRIPLQQDITHTRSYCPKCNHRLSFFDLIPVFSYVFLKGKCRYCHQKINIKYLLLEILSGTVFVLFSIPFKEKLLIADISYIAYFITGILYIAGLFILAFIDKEKKEIRNEIILYIIIIETLYIIYLYILEQANVYRYVMYLFEIVLLIIVNNMYFSKKAKNSYTIQCLMVIMAMLIFTYEQCVVLTIIFTLLSISIKEIIKKITCKKFVKSNEPKTTLNNVPVVYYLCICNIIVLISSNIMVFTQLYN